VTLHAAGNFVEAMLWIAIGVGLFVKTGKRFWLAASALLAFGVSDLVEIRTGHWARPWWLFAWKAACVAALLPIVVKALRTARSTRQDSPPAT